MNAEVKIVPIEQTDARLGRHIVHDPASRRFAMPVQVDRSTWHTKTIRIYDPVPNPNQPVGNCTMCAKAMQFNAVGNRRTGVVLGMDWALDAYRWETANDEFPGAWEPDDTGSSGLASCKTAIHLGDGGEYRWLFGGADEVVQAIMDGHTPSLGTYWYNGMFKTDGNGVLHPTGGKAGGHQWIARGYRTKSDMIVGRCWWGGFKDFLIARGDVADLLADGGDAHIQFRA